MPGELRYDPLTDDWVNIVGHRQRRPNLPSDGCPFCVGGLEAPEPYDVRWFTNRWPAYAPGPIVDLDAARAGGIERVDAIGTTEVVLFSPDHTASLASMPCDHVRKVVDLWADRTEALLSRDEIEYVLVFENHGIEVGATIAHPHGQIYAYGFVPPEPRRESDAARRAGHCPVCAETDRELHDESRIVAANDTWVAYVPFAATHSYGLRIAARSHVASFVALDDDQRDGLASILGDVLGRYERLWAAEPTPSFPYLLWFHQAPKHHDGEYHLHAHTAPPLRAPGLPRFVASGELGGGTLSNPVEPEAAAAALRDA